MTDKRLHILVAPLNWGLGHASRMIPVIYALKDLGHDVNLATDGLAYELFKREFTALNLSKMPGYEVTYSKSRFLIPMLLMQGRHMYKAYRRDKKWIDDFLRKNDIDIIISDNRFGAFHPRIYSIYLSHQLHPRLPILLRALQWIPYVLHQLVIRNYDKVLVPDLPNQKEALSGALSRSKKAGYIGPLSRFMLEMPAANIRERFDVVAVLSGPEPQRSLFEKILLHTFRNYPEKRICIIRGKPGSNDPELLPHVKMYDHLNSPDFYALLRDTACIICRSGYTTLMDLYYLKRKAVLVPTPGQTEQEYLAEHFHNLYKFPMYQQNTFIKNFKLPQDGMRWNSTAESNISFSELKNYLTEILKDSRA